MKPKGTVVVDELIIPITDIYLDDGKIWIVAKVTGPIRAVDAHNYTVNGRDGATVVHADGINGLRWRALDHGERLTVITPMEFMGREGWAVDA